MPIFALLPALTFFACHPDDADKDSAFPSRAPVSDVSVARHPDIVTVLQVTWTQNEAVDEAWIGYTWGDGAALTTPKRSFTEGSHTESIFGIPPENDVDIRLVEMVDGEPLEVRPTGTSSTGALPGDFPVPELITYDSDLSGSEPYLLLTVDAGQASYSGPWWVYIIDRQANVLWYYRVPDQRLAVMSRVSYTGTHVTWGESAWWGDPGSIERATLDLSWRVSTETPDLGYTYDEHPDGTFAYDYWTYDDMGIGLAPPSGSRTRVWSCNAWLPKGHSAWDCGTNTVNWNEARGSWLWSLYEVATIIEVDGETHTAIGSWGDIGEDPLAPKDARLQMQHFPNWTADGTLLLHTQEAGNERIEHAREFSWNSADNSLTQIWSYTATDRYADCSGEAVRLSNGNTLLNYGCGGFIREVTPSGDVAWEVATHELVGHQTLFTDLYALNRGE